MDANIAWKLVTKLATEFPGLTASRAITLAEEINAIIVFSPETWVRENLNSGIITVSQKITAIKALRAAANEAGQIMGLKDAKDFVEDGITAFSLDQLREKLAYPEPDSYDLGENEDRAFAESRERLAERGTWFGTPGPLDEEPY